MKKENKFKLHRGIVSCLSFFVLACSTMIGQAQTTNNPNYFDTSASTASWVTWWGGGSISAVNYSWDSAVDATNRLNSGSLLGVASFTGAAGDQFMTFCTFANRWQWDGGVTLNGRNYSTLSFDIRIEPSTGRTIAGNYGTWEFGFVPTGWDSGKLTTYSVPVPYTNAWVHVSVPINPAAPVTQTFTNVNVRTDL